MFLLIVFYGLVDISITCEVYAIRFFISTDVIDDCTTFLTVAGQSFLDTKLSAQIGTVKAVAKGGSNISV